jgi:four helix bundle protein
MPVDEEKSEKQNVRGFQDFNICQKANQWVLGISQMTDDFTKNENFGLTSQFRRAVVFIQANFARYSRASA